MLTTNKIKPLLFFLLVLMGYPSTGYANDYTQNDFKIALVGQFIKNISWPSKTESNNFNLVVAEDSGAMATFSVLQGEVIKGQKINVVFAKSLSRLPQAHLVYISKLVTGDVNNTINKLRGSGTLVITENHATLHNVMINIIDQKPDDKETYKLTFQINKPNLLAESLTPDPEMVLLGGTELDVVEMYRQAEQAMQKLQQELWVNQQQLDQQLIDLDLQRANVSELNRELNLSYDALAANQRELDDKQQQLASFEQQLTRVQEENRAMVSEAENTLELARGELLKANQELRDNQELVDTAREDLAFLEQQVERKNQQLNNAEQQLLSVNKDLEKQTSQVENQAQVIDRQSSIILASLVSLVIFVLATAIIAKVSMRNKRITRELESTLEDLKNTQKELVESEKLASLGRLVGGIAHEFNTPLGVVVTSSSTLSNLADHYSVLLKEKRLTERDFQHLLSTLKESDSLIQNNLARCSKLIRNFRQVSSDQIVASYRKVKMKDNVNEVMESLAYELQRANVGWRVEGDNPVHRLDPNLLAQVLNKLVENAIEHGFSERSDRFITVTIVSQGDTARIEFNDNGVGMDEQTKSNIFEPFFTTSRDAGATGLGLNIVHNLVTAKLNGTIEVESELGKGTRLVIQLPKDLEAAA